MNDKPKPAIEMVTLKQLCAELKVDPREARGKLRLAVRDVKKNPELAKSHKPGKACEWPKNSPALREVRAVFVGDVLVGLPLDGPLSPALPRAPAADRAH